MSDHHARVFRDMTTPSGTPFAWRCRCTCMGRLPRDPDWKPHWAAASWDGAMAIVRHHLSWPSPLDWLYLDEKVCR